MAFFDLLPFLSRSRLVIETTKNGVKYFVYAGVQDRSLDNCATTHLISTFEFLRRKKIQILEPVAYTFKDYEKFVQVVARVGNFSEARFWYWAVSNEDVIGVAPTYVAEELPQGMYEDRLYGRLISRLNGTC